MPKFNVTVEFGLTTEVEPDVSGHDFDYVEDADGVTESDDQSYWRSETVRVDGGSINLVIEADDEDDATEKAEQAISDGHEVEDRNGLTWLVEDVNVTDVQPVEEPMTKERATAIVQAWLETMPTGLTVEVRDALIYLLQNCL